MITEVSLEGCGVSNWGQRETGEDVRQEESPAGILFYACERQQNAFSGSTVHMNIPIPMPEGVTVLYVQLMS